MQSSKIITLSIYDETYTLRKTGNDIYINTTKILNLKYKELRSQIFKDCRDEYDEDHNNLVDMDMSEDEICFLLNYRNAALDYYDDVEIKSEILENFILMLYKNNPVLKGNMDIIYISPDTWRHNNQRLKYKNKEVPIPPYKEKKLFLEDKIVELLS